MSEWRDLVQGNVGCCCLPRGPTLVPHCKYLLELLSSLNDVCEFLLHFLSLNWYRFVSVRTVLLLLYLMSLELI